MATGIGETLRTARRQQGVALSDAVAQTRVRESYLTALEEENFAVLGGHVYAKGFLRSYARFLGLDPEPLVDAYRAEHEQPDEVSPLAQQQPAFALPTQRRSGLVVGLGVTALVLVVFFVIGLGADSRPGSDVALRAPQPVPTSEPASAAAPSPSRQTERARPKQRSRPDKGPRSTQRPRSNQEPARGPNTVPAPNSDPTERVTGNDVDLELASTGGDSWMRVTVDGVERFEGVQSEGQRESYSGQSITVRIGDAGVVDVTVNGQERGHLGERRQVVDKTYTVAGSA
ncbi:MAG: helix-turn-helix domain-containing protein [Euzebyaceae bacterium]|jgi:cytoskeletal protein RodZ|nr:helix-turn-helix domain-containing protein [Euzebyaceae bacterium]